MSNLIAVLQKNLQGRIPFWFMRQAGRYLPEYREVRSRCKGFLDLCYTPELAAEVTLQPIRRFDMDAAILFSDILVVPHALGCEVQFVEGEGPKLKPIRSNEDLSNFSLAKVEDHIQPVLETVRRVRAELSKDKTLIGFAGSPWTVACYMVEGGGSKEFGEVRKLALKEPELFTKLITLLEQATLFYLKAQVHAGAEVIQLFDSWAGILPPAEFEQWVIKPTARIVKNLKQAFPTLPVIGFPRLAGVKCVDYAATTGVDGVSIDHTMPMEWCVEHMPTVLQGNLDPYLLANDLPGALAEAKRICEIMHGRSFIFNLGHGMLPQTPMEYVHALSDFLKT